ncbi:hypothetical protein EXIGLDRAFT_33014 [Exidia glandulosa HHB12029]|uniref:Methyltransferase domain-containing protein n=1 Tax=Exidia glandulosa HHB12029 TaxID=1314781 RepID=A0A166ANY3_EXIGL|nr:hypothetical protein EXIGLDRAFT_33014 [Exidia glandulosa HHB12029]
MDAAPRPPFPSTSSPPGSASRSGQQQQPSPQAKSRRRTSSLALGLLGVKRQDSNSRESPTSHAPVRPPRDPRRSMVVERSALALALEEDEPPLPAPLPATSAKTRPSTPGESVRDALPGQLVEPQLRPPRPSASSRARLMTNKTGARRPPASVPYPRNYDRDVLDHDVWENEFFKELCGGVTWHDFKTPPAKVLDLGCGTGAWVMSCAKVWKKTHFVGLDIAPLQPDLELLGSDLAPRIKWVHANFLERLPFDDCTFDFVHIRRIARGVPEPRWDDLFEEIARVMKKGGAFEIIEEDLNFPGSTDFPTPHPDVGSPIVAGPSRAARPGTASSSKRLSNSSMAAGIGSNAHGRPLVNPHDHSELELIYTEMHAARWINLEVLSLLNSMLVLHFVDVRSHAPVHISFPPTDGKKVNHVGITSSMDSSSSASVSPTIPKQELTRQRSGRIAPPKPDAPTTDIASAVPPRLRGQSVSKVPPVPPVPSVVPQASTSASPVPSVHNSPTVSPTTSPSSQKPSPRLDIPVSPASSSTPSSPFTTQPWALPSGSKLVRTHTLPNTNWNFDPATLPLHLSLRVSEVRACFDAMWDWLIATGQGTDDPTGVRPPMHPNAHGLDNLDLPGTKRWNERQAAAALSSLGASVVVGAWAGIATPSRESTASLGPSVMQQLSMASNGSGTSSSSGTGSGVSGTAAAGTVGPAAVGADGVPVPGVYTPRGQRRLTTRAELERLMDRFEMDMHDHIALSCTLSNKLNWQAPRDHPPSAERKAFHESVALWDDYQQQVHARRNAQPGEVQSHQAPVPLDPSPLKLSRTVRAFVAWKAS